MTPNLKATMEVMLKNALLSQLEDRNNSQAPADYDQGYLHGMIRTLETLLETGN